MAVVDIVARVDQIRTGIAALDPAVLAPAASNAAAFESALISAENPNGVSGADVLAKAKEYLGVPYVFGGTTRAGMDCSGLVQTVFKDLGVSMPRVVPDQGDMGVEVPSLAEAKPGDLIELKGHIVIYAGDNTVVHAPRPGRFVQEQKIWFDESDIVSIRRIVPAEKPIAASVPSTPDIQALLALLSGQGSGLFGGMNAPSSPTSLIAAAQMAMFSGGTQ